ncbi:hypothetical protein GGX14DRAFT_309540, partial [Mycena pura]
EWLYRRLVNLAEVEDVHYEASFMGPHNALLTSYFRVEHGWLVKPIPRLRKPVPEDDADSRTSIDSYGVPVVTSNEDPQPDSLVCKASAGLDGDRPVLLWEVKRNDAQSAKSSRQMDRYEEWLRQYQQHVWDK